MSTLASSAAAATARPAGPNRLRFALLVLVGVYPLVTGISYAIAPFTAGWQIWQRGLLLAPIMVPAMVYGLIPFIQTRFRGWLMK
jgi:antibiotic biosynthesis monooxygenase (ABM) superfamily enzyme